MNKTIINKNLIRKMTPALREIKSGVLIVASAIVSAAILIVAAPNSSLAVLNYIAAFTVFTLLGCGFGLRYLISGLKFSSQISKGEYILEKDKLIRQEWFGDANAPYRTLTFEHNIAIIDDVHTPFMPDSEFYIIKFHKTVDREGFKPLADLVFYAQNYELAKELCEKLSHNYKQTKRNSCDTIIEF